MQAKLNINRRTLLGGLAAGGLATPYFFTRAKAQDNKRIVVYNYDGALGKFAEEYYIKPFEEKYDVKVDAITVVGAASPIDRLAAQIQAGRPEVDVMWVQPPAYVYCVQNDLMVKLKDGDLPEAANFRPEYMTEHGPMIHLYAYGYAYNTEIISDKPTSWRDLWDPKFKGKLAVNDALYEQFLAVTNLAFGRGVADVGDETFKALTELRPSIVSLWSTGAQAEQLFRNREVAISPIWNGRAYNLISEGVPLEFVVPEEGYLLRYNAYGVARGASNPDLALQYINYIMSDVPQSALAEKFFYATGNKKVVYPNEEIARKVILGHPDYEGRDKLEDFAAAVANSAEWARRWNQWKAS